MSILRLSWRYVLGVLLCVMMTTALAQTVTVKMMGWNAKGQAMSLGTVILKDTRYGVLITPALHDLTPGAHGFHLHVNASCANRGMAAGGHYDPYNTGKHLGPYGQGHLGDLPVLVVDKSGDATLPVLAPRLTVRQMKGHALMIHGGGDNYSDQPLPLGGGGVRIGCGVVS